MLHPLTSMAVLALVFSTLLNVRTENYALFLLCGLLPWNYLNSTVTMSLDSVRNNSRIFSQVPVPKFMFVLSIAVSNFANLFFALVPLVILMVAFKQPLHATALSFPIFILPVLLTTVGISLFLAALNVFFNDTRHLTEVALGLVYFLSPILYDRSMVPVSFHKWLEWNPLLYQIEQLRGIFFSGTFPSAASFFLSLCISLLILLVGLVFFRRCEDKFLYHV